MIDQSTPDGNVFQIYIQEEEAGSLPDSLQQCVDTVRNAARGCVHVVLGKEELRAILEKEFDRDVLRAFDALVPFAYKADLARYCLLYAFGGWYFDIAARANCVLPTMHGIDNLIFRDAPNAGAPSWDVSNGLLYSRRGSPEYDQAIKMILDNCRTEYFGINALCPTGPNLLGRAFAMCGARAGNVTGMFLPLTPHHKAKNYAYVLPDGTLFAWGKRTLGTAEGGGLAAMGGKGTNSYAHLFATRSIYSHRS